MRDKFTLKVPVAAAKMPVPATMEDLALVTLAMNLQDTGFRLATVKLPPLLFNSNVPVGPKAVARPRWADQRCCPCPPPHLQR